MPTPSAFTKSNFFNYLPPFDFKFAQLVFAFAPLVVCMAARLLAYEVADLCLGKPPLRSLSSSATVAHALAAVKSSDDNFVSIWMCDHSAKRNLECVCVGKVCMVDIICYLCREENLSSPALALKAPVSVLLSSEVSSKGLVRHLKSSSSLLEAIDLILQGAQNLIVPINTNNQKRKQLQRPSSSICPTNHNGRQFCWLTQEDVIRFILNSIALFSPTAALSVNTLGIITTDFISVEYHSPARLAVSPISRALVDQTSVAVVDSDKTLIGEISPFTLACCNESTAAAIATLSAGDLMAYIDCGGPPEEIVKVVEARLRERGLDGVLEEFARMGSYDGDVSNSSTDDDEEFVVWRSGRLNRLSSYSARMVRKAEAIVCHGGSSLVAVMIQAIAHRVSYVWVIEDDCSVVGIVTFANMLGVFSGCLRSMI